MFVKSISTSKKNLSNKNVRQYITRSNLRERKQLGACRNIIHVIAVIFAYSSKVDGVETNRNERPMTFVFLHFSYKKIAIHLPNTCVSVKFLILN